MASVFSRTRSKSTSKSKDHKEKDLCKGHEKETQFIEHGAAKKTGQGKHAKETVSVGGQDGMELSSSLEASAGDRKKKEKKERGFSFSKSKGPKKKPPDQAATSPSKKPSATTPSSPGDPTMRTSAELYQSPERQRDQQKLAEVSLGAGISGRIPSTTSCDSQASGSLVSPNSLEGSFVRIRELEAKLQSSEEMRSEEMQRSEQEHDKILAELKEKHAEALEEKAKELEKAKDEFETILSAKEQELLQQKTEEFRALQQRQQQEWQTELEKRESEFETTLSVREQELVHKKNEELRALQQQQQQEWQTELEKRKNEYESRLSVREQEMIQKMQAKTEEFRASQHQQQQKWQTELEEKDKQHKLEMDRKQKQYVSKLENKQKAMTALLQKQLREKDEEINAKELEIEKLQDELTQKEKQSIEGLQHVKDSQSKIVQEQESQLQKMRKELSQKDEDLQLKLHEKDKQAQRFVQKAEKRLQDEQERHNQEKQKLTEKYEAQLLEATQRHQAEKDRLLSESQQIQHEQKKHLEEKENEKEKRIQQFALKAEKQLQEQKTQLQERHAQEKAEMADKYEAQLQEVHQQHQAERERLLNESQQLQHEQKRHLEEMADKVKHYEEQQEEVIKHEHTQETDKVTKVHEVQIEQLKQQQKRALEEKDRQLTATLSQLQEEKKRHGKEIEDRRREFQTRLADAAQKHKADLEEQQRQYDLTLKDISKQKDNALEMQAAHIKRNYEKELQSKAEENAQNMEQKIQRREGVLRQELQQKDEVLHQQNTQLKRYEQEVLEKNAKIAHLESELSGSEHPIEEKSTLSENCSATLHRIPVQSRTDDVAGLHSNVVDLAREISHYVDPENVLPSVRCCHPLNPLEVKRVIEVLGSQNQLQEHKPQNYLFAVLPADNHMHSVLFDYTGTFRPSPDDQEACPLPITEEEDSFDTPPTTPTEVPLMNPLDASARDVAANLPDSEKVKRLQQALDGHARLHADMKEENERWQHEIAELKREKDTNAQELMVQSQEIQALKKSIEEKEEEIQEKAQAIEAYQCKVEQRDRQLDLLKKPPTEAVLSAKALEEYDMYFDQVLKLTEELTVSEAKIKKLEQELGKHEKLIKRAEVIEEQAAQGALELSKKEQQIKELARGTTVPRGAEELEDEVDRLRPFEDKGGRLKSQLMEAHEHEIIQHQLEQEVENLSATKVQLEEALQEQKSEFESRLSKLEEDLKMKTLQLDELEHLREEYGKLELQIKQKEFSMVKVEGATNVGAPHVNSEAAKSDEVRALEEKLQDRDEELQRLRQQATGSLVPLQTSLKYDDLPPGTDPMVEIATLKEALESKDRKIESLQVQVRSFEDVIKHTKEQSKQVLKLKQELKTVQKDKGASKARTELLEQTGDGTDLVAQLEQLKEELSQIENEKQKVEKQRDGFQREVEQLRADLAVTDNEGVKEEKKQKEEAVTLRLQLAAGRSENDRLQHQVEQTEATVRELEIKLNTSEATVAQQTAEAIQLQSALSDAETSRRDISQKLTKLKEDHRVLDQKYLSVLAVNENLQSEVSRIECIQNEVAQVKEEALRWKKELATKKAELTQLKGSTEEIAKLKENMETLRKENAELQGDLEAQRVQAAIWKQDFEGERHEREQAAGRRDDEQAMEHIYNQKLQIELKKVHSENEQLQSELQLHQASYKEVTTRLAEVENELVKHKDQVANWEHIFQSQQAQLKQANQELHECKAQQEQANKLHKNQLDDIHRQLRHAHGQLDEAVTNNEKLNDDVLAKTQQVKQYKKQVDGLKTELAKYTVRSQVGTKSHQPQDKEESDLQTAILQSKEVETARQLAELRKERDALRTEVEQLKSGKMNERHFSAAFQKEFEKRGEFQAKYHEVLDRCAELFERAQQLHDVLEQHNIPIPDPPPKQRAPPADIPRAMIPQHPLVARSDDDARLHVHSQMNQGDPAHYHASPPTARANPLPSNIPPGVGPHSHPPQPYEFRQPPAPIVPLPQHGGGQIYQPHEAAEMYVQPQHLGHQPYVEGECGHVRGQPMYQAPIHDPQQPVSYREPLYDENMPCEHEAVMKDYPMNVQMQHEHEALMAQQRERELQEQSQRFHREQQKHGALIRQGYSVDDPHYGPHKRQAPHHSLTAKSITSPHLLVEHRQRPSPPVSPGIRHASGLQYHIGSDHMHGPPHPREVDPHAIHIGHQQQLEQIRLQKQQAEAQMQAQNAQQHNMLHIQDYQQMLYAQHQHNQPQHPTPRLYGDRPLPQSQPRYPLADHNIHPHDQFMQPAHNIPSHDQLMHPAQPPPHHLSPSSNQAQIAAQHPVDMQPEVPGNNQPQDHYSQGEAITPVEEETRDFASAQVSKSVEETHPDLPEQRHKQNSEQQDENRLMKGLNTEIHETAAGVEANVQSEEESSSLEGAPMDPNLVCPMCARGYRVGEIQKYRRHVKSCRGSK